MTPSANQNVKLIALYARVSTSRQEEDGTIETQLLALREFAAKNGYAIVKEYVDNGWSGDVLARPSLDNLRHDAKQKIWEAVLVYDPDRLARRYSYQELVMDELREAGIEVMFLTVSAPKNPEDKILHGVRGLFAEYERAKITERFRLGKLRKVKEDHLLVSVPAYGYNYVPQSDAEHGYYEINEDEAKVVRLIFKLIAEDGFTLRKVSKKLQELRILPRRSPKGIWNISSLSRLTKNRVYIGEARWGSSYSVVPVKPLNQEKYKKNKKSSRRMKPEAEWIAPKITVPAIVERDIFERAQKQMQTNFALCPRNKKHEYLLAGKIYCVCGRHRTGEAQNRAKHLYYRCADRILTFPLPRTCMERALNARVADQLVWDKISSLMSSPEMLSAQVNRWLGSKRAQVKHSTRDIKGIEKEIEKLKDQEERYTKAYGAGLFAIEKLKEYTTPIRERVSVLEKESEKVRNDASRINKALLPGKVEIKRYARRALKALQDANFATRRAVVTNVVEKIVATPKSIEVSGYIPVSSSVQTVVNA